MSVTFSNAFTKQFEKDVHLVYQRRGTKLRGTTRMATITDAKDTTFQIAGKGIASVKAVHGDIPVMNIAYSNVTCTLADYYTGEWSDKLDEQKTNIDAYNVITKTSAFAMGRKTDDLIITALTTATNAVVVLGTASEKAFRNSMLTVTQKLDERDVPDDDDMRFAAVSPSVFAWLMTIEQFASSRYTGPELPYLKPGMGTSVRSWLGYHWVKHTGLGVASQVRTVFFYHSDAIGHAIGSDVVSDLMWYGHKASTFAGSRMSQGAVLIDNNGVQKATLDESVALPTS